MSRLPWLQGASYEDACELEAAHTAAARKAAQELKHGVSLDEWLKWRRPPWHARSESWWIHAGIRYEERWRRLTAEAVAVAIGRRKPTDAEYWAAVSLFENPDDDSRMAGFVAVLRRHLQDQRMGQKMVQHLERAAQHQSRQLAAFAEARS